MNFKVIAMSVGTIIIISPLVSVVLNQQRCTLFPKELFRVGFTPSVMVKKGLSVLMTRSVGKRIVECILDFWNRLNF